MKKSCKELITEYKVASSILQGVIEDGKSNRFWSRSTDQRYDYPTALSFAQRQLASVLAEINKSNCRRNRRV